jgi:hypothetical protein
MGLLNLFKRADDQAPGLTRLPSGSFTVDASGKTVVSTLPRAVPEAAIQQISMEVLSAFRSAREAGLPLSEVAVQYTTLRLTARELRGGAIIFLAPRALENR